MKKFCLLFLLSLNLTGCLYYDYAVDKTKINLPYRTYYYDDSIDHPNHDFTTVLYSQDLDHSDFNYSDFTVYIEHLQKPSQHDKAERFSRICFEQYDKTSLTLLHINLSYKNSDGHMVKPLEQHDIQGFDKELVECFYQVYADDEQLTDKMSETVTLTMQIDGKKIAIHQTYPIRKALHYTFWDIMLGV